jgi:UDP-N-acetylmuramoylalanine--D-glutamate ligase
MRDFSTLKTHTLSGKRITVLGAGRTGQAVARFLASGSSTIFVSDHHSIPAAVQQQFADLGIPYEAGGHSTRALQADLIVPSPGVPFDAPVLQEARARGIPILSEVELAYRLCPTHQVIAVTGTVGKTTTTHLIAALLQAYGYKIVVAGNIGQPLIARLAEIDPQTIVVLEVSSFQLEHVSTFRPLIGIFTRFAPHHLDRHGSLENYFALKCRLFAHQTEDDYALVNQEITLPRHIRSQIRTFSADEAAVLPLEIPRHQREDLAGALMAARLIDPEIRYERLDMKSVFRLPHRLQFVAEVGGTRFYNDSKATSTAATLAALSAFREPLVLILGGYDEAGDLHTLARVIQERDVQAVFLLGQTSERWVQAFRHLGYRHFHRVQNLDQAVEETLRLAPAVCLFSPASPSFDQFQNYEERGECFQQIVRSYLLQTAITRWSDQLATAP